MCKTPNGKKWIFRGHPYEKPLQSSLERAVQYYRVNLREPREAEKSLLRDFKRRYHQYSSDPPKDDDDLEWFSIMQHYGAPTRLLDFTYSPYIAAYFALEYTRGIKDSMQFEIYAIDANWAIEQTINCNGGQQEVRDFFKGPVSNACTDRKKFKDYFMSRKAKQFACPFNPFRLTERISLQNGVFVCPGNVDFTFQGNLRSLDGWDDGSIVRMVLEFNRDKIIEARSNLYDRNITRATLFPGLDGFSRSLEFSPPKMLLPSGSQ